MVRPQMPVAMAVTAKMAMSVVALDYSRYRVVRPPHVLMPWRVEEVMAGQVQSVRMLVQLLEAVDPAWFLIR